MLIFFFCYLMIYHHDILMNMFLLNNSILQNQYNVEDKKLRKNQVADLTTAESESKFHHRAYSYSELAMLKHCSCCLRKKARYRKYKEHMAIMADRLDIAAIFSGQGYINALSNVLMEPYQMKIVSYFKKKQDDSSKLAYAIPIETAIDQLRQRSKKDGPGGLESKINDFLLKIVGEEERQIDKERLLGHVQDRLNKAPTSPSKKME